MEIDFPCETLNPTVYFVCKQKRIKECIYHDHDFPQISVILSGKGKYLIQGEEYAVEAGDILFLDAKTKHHNIVTDVKNPMVEFFVGFSDIQFYDMPENSIEFGVNPKIMHMKTHMKQEVNKICYEMLAEYQSGQPGKEFMMKAYMSQLLIQIVRGLLVKVKKMEDTSYETYNRSYAVRRIINYLNENYEQRISLEQIAHNMYLSPVYISKIFKEETGESPINYLIKIRLERAKEFLQTSNGSSIKNIAKQVGYDDVYHFSKLFKKYYGISPLYYKKNIREKMNA
ncbi:AraC family transcriptional regulator [Anaerosporobacter faecicola]|uniref:AraC family transcriptional regulator n=1 Tax=Anaerosporobacter faecicola TaxID=2718714 RepID=UPI00143AA57A|nr:AraC family transcriptional regulator [Anaerosporobacter faecicola]